MNNLGLMMQNRNRKGHDNNGSSGDDSAPITLPLLSLTSALASPVTQGQTDAPGDASDHTPIVLPLKEPKAAKARRRRARRRRRLQSPPRVNAESREDQTYRLLEEEQAALFYVRHLQMEEHSSRQAATLLHEETARTEEHHEQMKWQETAVEGAEDGINEDFAQRVREYERAQAIRQ